MKKRLIARASAVVASSGLKPLDIGRGIKKFFWIFLVLLIVGGSGLYVALGDFTRLYRDRDQRVQDLSAKVDYLQKKVGENKYKVENYQFLQFKANAFARRYPIYSHILEVVYDKSLFYGFEPDLVLSIVHVESDCNPNAVSYQGACGLMQVNLPVWRNELNIDSQRIFEVDYNVDLGLRIFRKYYDVSDGNIKQALHMYNNGYGNSNMNYTGKINSTLLTFKPVALDLTVGGVGK